VGCNTIMAVVVSHRTSEALKVQQVLTRHGCIVRLRVGLHETGKVCAEDGLILLGLSGTRREAARLKADLQKLRGVKVKTMAV